MEHGKTVLNTENDWPLKRFSRYQVIVKDEDKKQLDRDISGDYALYDTCGSASFVTSKGKWRGKRKALSLFLSRSNS